MYSLSKRLKLTAMIAMVLGAIAILIGFSNAPHSIQDVEQILASQQAHHGQGHDTHKAHQAVQTSHDSHHSGHQIHQDHNAHQKHLEHVLHQLSNKPWAALYVAAFFFFMIALGTLVFYAIQFAAQAGWSPVLFRVMEGITAYLIPGGIILFVILAASTVGHLNHIFVWANPDAIDPNSEHYDALIAGKSAWLNGFGFLIRAAIYLAGWIFYRNKMVTFTKNQDENPEGNVWFKKSFKASAAFLVFFIYTESMMSWDWIMSFDPHWFSTLFGWYVFASMFVSGITVIALVTIYLKSKGLLEYVNDSHIHDLAKFMFGISVFWTYLWFSQFLLIWYSNIPEEVTYYITRIEDYNLPFFGMVVLNFVFPLLVLVNSDFKRINWFVIFTVIVILCGHYLDIFNMVMPATVGKSWSIGISEIGSVLFFGGLFVLCIFKAISKSDLLASGNPFMGESKRFHY